MSNGHASEMVFFFAEIFLSAIFYVFVLAGIGMCFILSWNSKFRKRVTLRKITCHRELLLLQEIHKYKRHKTGVINDPLGQTHSFASSGHYF